MGVTRVQHIYNPKSAMPADQVVNTFYFRTAVSPTDTSNMTPAQLLSMQAAVVNFYDATPTGFQKIKDMIAEGALATTRHTLKFYNMDDAAPRAPYNTFSTTGGGVFNNYSALPSEVAFCLSFRGELVSGSLAARRRGRIFLGPIASSRGTFDTTTGHLRPEQAMQLAAVGNAKLLQQAAGAAGCEWVVYSPTNRSGVSAYAATTRITYAWADNAWDTQRRRGATSTAREVNQFGLVYP